MRIYWLWNFSLVTGRAAPPRRPPPSSWAWTPSAMTPNATPRKAALRNFMLRSLSRAGLEPGAHTQGEVPADRIVAHSITILAWRRTVVIGSRRRRLVEQVLDIEENVHRPKIRSNRVGQRDIGRVEARHPG